jgi:hypothetical protein
LFDYLKDIKPTPYDHQAVCDALKGIQPGYRETAEPWALTITGEKPKTVWYGEDEDEDGGQKQQSTLPVKKQLKAPTSLPNINLPDNLPSSHPLGLPSKKSTKRKSPFSFNIPPPKRGFDELLSRPPKSE